MIDFKNYLNLKVFVLFALIIVNLIFNFNNLINTNLNTHINDELFCMTSNYSKKEFEELNKKENFILYYLPKFAKQEFLNKLC